MVLHPGFDKIFVRARYEATKEETIATRKPEENSNKTFEENFGLPRRWLKRRKGN